MIRRYIIYGLIGWNVEVIWTGLWALVHGDMHLSGATNLWMFFIYGLAVFLEPVHEIIKKWRWPLRGIIWVMIIWGIEYSTGLILSLTLGFIPWEYDGVFAIDGLIRLDFAPAWFIAGLLFEKVHTIMDRYLLGSS